MKRLLSTLPLEESKLRHFFKTPLRSKNTSLRKETSPRMVTLGSVLMSISISESSMIPTQVFSVWTSTLFSEELVREFPEESMPRENLENIKELPLRMLSNGSPRRWPELSFDEASWSNQIF